MPAESAVYDDLHRVLGDRLIRATDAAYDAHRRCWNRLFDHRPGAIARCESTEDVVACVNFARSNGLMVAVRGGGHCYAGTSSCDDGLVIDLSAMQGVDIDTASNVATIAPGTKWNEVFATATPLNLAIPAPPPQAGVAGATLGGGVGALSRKWGLTLDNLVAAEVVTAAGEVVVASATDNEDLFWALRGGGGNFGIVTRFELQLHPLGPEVLAGQVIYRWDDAGAVLRQFRDFIADAPHEVGAMVLVFTVPPLEFFPADTHGQSALAIAACYGGPADEGQAHMSELASFGTPILNTVAKTTFEAFKHADDAAIEAWDRVYCKTHNFQKLTDDAIDVFVERGAALSGDVTLCGLIPMNGAISQVAADATAYPNRHEAWECSIWASWSDPQQDESIKDWTQSFHAALAPWADGSAYVNILAADDADRVEATYAQNWARLRQIKAKWDPSNLFRRNHNIPPS